MAASFISDQRAMSPVHLLGELQDSYGTVFECEEIKQIYDEAQH